MTELMAFSKIAGDDVKPTFRRRTPPMARMSAAFERDGLGRSSIVVRSGASCNEAYGQIAIGGGKKKKEEPVVAVVEAKPKPTIGFVLKKASAKAFRGGVAGFIAGMVQVGSFMWLRTAMNYQYANGGNMFTSIGELYKQGGIPRLYKGFSFAIIQNPLSRFGDTAANTGVLCALEAYYPQMPVTAMTAFASVGGACWRIFLTPVDTFKTTLQVQGDAAFELLKQKVKTGGIGVLYSGAAANFAANWVGNFPWFATYNYLQNNVPKQEGKKKLLRNALIGIISSCVSDTVSNSLRVIKTVKQTSGDANLSYIGAIKGVMEKDGLSGLFGRGLQTRLFTNILQSMVFSVAWKAIEEELNRKADAKEAATVK
eukprot:CAMPEP_0196580110 /NCGR_PEP_ID=MMETSP1081-20130531/27022_1 /TAXON_ID=36882 /ORGANISM="Pyramimonas amylifera, Strain CCMP720" /LENGTH=369 /DNA_ID=CAMNT_0041899897 /DNA_START=52 /DNA_END=1161 /DNA_ORIENTATION=-